MQSHPSPPTVDLRNALSLARAIETVIDPAVAVLWLVAFAEWLRLPIDAFAVISVVMVFALTFPGAVRMTDSLARVAFMSIWTSLMVLGGMALLGLAVGWFAGVGRTPLLLWLAALPVSLFAVHLLSRTLLPRIFSLSHLHATVVICGINEIGSALAAQFRINPYHGVKFVGFFDDRNSERGYQIEDHKLLGTFDDLGDYVRRNHVDRIYLALPMATQPRIVKMLDDLKNSTASIYFVPDMFVTEVINGRMESVAGIPVVAVRDSPFASVLNSIAKRTEDLVLAGPGLVLIAPLLALIALGIRLDSPGPAIFRQRRYGLDGREIIIYKFRTMTVTEDGAATFQAAKREDSRVTRFGHFLRRTSLDELPQVINVVQGRMSLVGPRPHVVAMNEQYRKLIPGYMLRHKIKPGITGLAQIRGFRGGDNLDEMTKRASSDLEYLRNWTLGLDLWILARTAFIFLGDRRAY